jgi:MFS family permease
MNAPAITVPDRIDPRRMIAFIAMCFGMFMAFLDIQIVSASLSEIQAGLAASGDEIPWVQTAYLIAEVVAIPLSGFLSRALGTRMLFAVSCAGFTFASLMCGLSTSIGTMIVWRAVQGFIGGGMIPTVFAAAFTVFPKSRQAIVTPIIGLVATLAPTIGPTVGGYLTEAMSWHWLFFINIVPGIAVTLTAVALIDFDKPDYSLLDHLDWWGLIAMAGFLGALEYVLEEGPRNYWLQDEAIAASEMKGKPPTKLGKIRRTSLPPDQAAVFNLKPGETSQLISTPNGYLVYKVGEKDTLPLDHVRAEIVSTLQSQRMQDSVQAIQKSATPELNPKYFSDAAADAPRGRAPEAAPPATKAPESGPK